MAGGGGEVAEAPLQVFPAEELAPGGLGRGLAEVGLLEPAGQHGLLHLPPGRPGSVRIEAEVAPAELLHGQIEQGVGGAAVPALHRGVAVGPGARRQQGEVGDPAQVEQGPPSSGSPQQGRIAGGTRGAPCPPRARSAARKSCTTGLPRRAASRGACSSCQLAPHRPSWGGRCQRVCPWQPTSSAVFPGSARRAASACTRVTASPSSSTSAAGRAAPWPTATSR